MKQRRLAARGQLFVSGALFGLMAALGRLASRDAAGFSAAQLTTVRFAVGTAMTLALFRLRPGTFRPVRRRLLVARGLQGGLAVLLYFVALSRIPAGQATLLNNLFPVFAVGISLFTLGERPTAHLALALALVTVGVALVIAPGAGALALADVGVLAGLASAVLGGGAVVAIRALRPTDNAPTIFFSFCLGGLACALPFSGGPWPHDPRLWALGAAVGVLSFFAQLLMTHAYGVFTVAEAALWQQLTPAASFLWSLAILGERLSPLGACGMVLGGCGVVYGSVLGHRPADPVAAPLPITEPVDPA